MLGRVDGRIKYSFFPGMLSQVQIDWVGCSICQPHYLFSGIHSADPPGHSFLFFNIHITIERLTCSERESDLEASRLQKFQYNTAVKDGELSYLLSLATLELKAKS